ncbi:glycosyltransferase family 2 protein [Candidatus Bathyarchaeota archaeon]|nr:MAG: glycosyltransferase family 2 protein [Candidatus Bathyarchaeota archaeon]
MDKLSKPEENRRKPYIIACIPAYNEEKTIAKVILKARKYVDKVIVCDDGSTDMTAEIAEALGAEVIRHERNIGYGAAIGSLFEKAKEEAPDMMITLDADGQHNPDDIPKLIKPIIDGEADIVIGSRFLTSEAETPTYRKIGIKIINWITGAKAKKISDTQSGYRAYSKKALQSIKPVEMGMGVSTEILLKAEQNNLKIKEVPIKISYGVERPSTINPLTQGLDVIFSTVKQLSIRHPLMFYGIPGTISLLVALGAGLMLIHLFNTTRYFSLPLAIITVGFGIAGAILCSTAVMLWILISIIREHERK